METDETFDRMTQKELAMFAFIDPWAFVAARQEKREVLSQLEATRSALDVTRQAIGAPLTEAGLRLHFAAGTLDYLLGELAKDLRKELEIKTPPFIMLWSKKYEPTAPVFCFSPK